MNPTKDPGHTSTSRDAANQSERQPARLSERGQLGRAMSHGSPFAFMRRFSEEMDRLFEGVMGGDLSKAMDFRGFGSSTAWPQIEMSQRDHELVISADLPGVAKDDVQIEVSDGLLSIEGQRRQERERTEHGVHRTERSYGEFCRQITLPEGADVEHAKAVFHDGILEITIPTTEVSGPHGRKIEIQGSASPAAAREGSGAGNKTQK